MTEGHHHYNRVEAHFRAMEAKKAPKRTSTNTPEKRVLLLTDAVRVSENVVLNLHEGFEVLRCNCGNQRCPGKDLCIAVTRQRIIDVFSALVSSLGESVRPVFVRPLGCRRQKVYSRDYMDPGALLNTLDRYEEVLLNDGYSLLTVENEEGDAHVHILPQKMLLVKTIQEKVDEFRATLKPFGIPEERSRDTILRYNPEPKTTPVVEAGFTKMLEELSMREYDPTDPTNFHSDDDDECESDDGRWK